MNESFRPIPPTAKDLERYAMDNFRQRHLQARKEPGDRFIGAYPNFFASDTAEGVLFIRSAAAQWQDIPLSELQGVAIDDFPGRMRATHVWARSRGFIGGFPTFQHADHGKGVVCGAILFAPDKAEWRDIPRSELGDVDLGDIAGRMRATHVWARNHGFIGGFPTFQHADHGRGVVCGTILLPDATAEWRDIPLPLIK